jgi:hypothetical protein
MCCEIRVQGEKIETMEKQMNGIEQHVLGTGASYISPFQVENISPVNLLHLPLVTNNLSDRLNTSVSKQMKELEQQMHVFRLLSAPTYCRGMPCEFVLFLAGGRWEISSVKCLLFLFQAQATKMLLTNGLMIESKVITGDRKFAKY